MGYLITFVNENSNEKYAWLVDGDELVLSTDADGTQISIFPGDTLDTVTLGPDDAGVGIVADANGVRLSSETATQFTMNVSATDENTVQFVAPGGDLLNITKPGEPIVLRDPSAMGGWFELVEPTPKVLPSWAADEGRPFDEGHSTHLWIFARAMDLIMTQGFYDVPNRDVLRYYLGQPEFVNAVKMGIYLADNSGMADLATSGFVFSAHFYNPEYKRGGAWGPRPERINALGYGVKYFDASTEQQDIVTSGRCLGLAIHYLQDLCQPMHSFIYVNFPGNKRHENYEQWVLNIQDSCALSMQEVMPNELPVKQTADRYIQAATQSLAVYQTWIGHADSPIGINAPGLTALDKKGANQPHPTWVPGTTQMLKLAQRLTIGLLMDWAAKPSMLVSSVLKDVGLEQLHIADRMYFRSLVAGNTYDGHVYHQPSNGRVNARWVLEPALDAAGNPVASPVDDGDSTVYHLRDALHNAYLVSGPTANGQVLQNPDKSSPNAMWTLEPVLQADGTPAVKQDPNSKKEYPVYYVRDMKWRQWMLAGSNGKDDQQIYLGSGMNLSNAEWAIDNALLS